MKPIFPKMILAGLGAFAIATLPWVGGISPALGSPQDPVTETKQAAPAPAAKAGAQSLAFPTGDRATSNLLVEVNMPAQLMVGKPHDYQIKVTNLTRNVMLDNLKVYQTKGEHFAVESSEPKADKADGKGDEVSWTIAKLGPGESQVIKATGLGDKEGQAMACVRVTYEPMLCMMTEFIKPAIQVVKTAPDVIDICDVINVKYTVTNTGTGPARAVKLHEDLPEGLTVKGGKSLNFEVGDLAQGQSREYTATIHADKPGDFGGRAVAEGQDDLTAKSNRTSTTVQEAKLAVALKGPDAEYSDEKATYQATVTNTGKAVARRGHAPASTPTPAST